MEKITYLTNGQWILEKGEPEGYVDHYSFGNHRPDHVFTGADAIAHQQIAHEKALKFNKHSVKKMPNEKGEQEDHILLHRGIEDYDKKNVDEYNRFKITPTHIESKDAGVHTLLPEIADSYSNKYETDDEGEEMQDSEPRKGKTVSFWVPKSKIHHMGGYAGASQKLDTHAENQKHTSIHPGTFQRATPEEVALVRKQPLPDIKPPLPNVKPQA